MKKQIVISVLSKDRPGIIADVANVIYELSGDLADMSQSVLNGFFSMIITAQFKDSISIDMIKSKMSNIQSTTDLDYIVKETEILPSDNSDVAIGDVYVVTAQGKNRTGLVSSISSFCRDKNINIIDYVTKLSHDTYSMILEIDIPENLSFETIHDELAKMAEDLGLKIVIQHKNLFETVNEISL